MSKPVFRTYPIIIILLLIFLSFTSFTQNLKFRNITPQDGLSSQFVKDISSDSTGFMWFATAGGLCRYDGYTFKTFRSIPGDTTSLSSNNVCCIIEIKKNEFLLGTYFGGLNRFNARIEEFSHFRHDPNDPSSISNNRVNIIFRDDDGNIWVGTHHGLNLFDIETQKFKTFLQFPGEKNHPSDQVNDIMQDKKGQLWIGTNDGLYLFDSTFHKVDIHGEEDASDRIIINCIKEVHDSSIWVGTNNWLYIIRNGQQEYISPQKDRSKYPSNNKIVDIIEYEKDGKHFLWLSTHWGLNQYDFTDMRFNLFYHERDNPESLNSNYLGKMYYDPSGNLWVSVIEHGVQVINHSKKTYINQVDIFGNNFGHSAACFYSDREGNLWVGSHSAGLLKFDYSIDLIKRFFPFFPDDKTHSSARITNILEDDHQHIIVSMGNPLPGVHIFDEDAELFYPIPFDSRTNMRAPGRIRDMLIDSTGIIWVGTSEGLYKISNSDNLIAKTYSIDGTAFEETWDLMLDHTDNLWVSTQKGLYKIVGRNSVHAKVQTYQFLSKVNTASFEYPRYSLESSSGSVWICTNRSLCIADLNNRVYQSADISDHLVNNNMIISIIEDSKGHLWMNTAKGLIRYDPERDQGRRSRLYDVSDGLPYEGYISTPMYLHPDGRIFVPANYSTQDGFYYFYPDSLTINDRIPNIVLTDLIIGNEEYRTDSSISTIKKLNLRYDQNFFTLHFTALDFTDPSKNNYAYILEGYDRDWNYSGTMNFANYTGVSPGNYIFYVKGSNNDGYWNEKGTSLTIKVLPPPWKSWWAILLYIIFIISIISTFLWYYMKRQQLRQKLALEELNKKKLEELDSIKSNFFANISHEFRTPLTLILGPLQRLIPNEENESKRQELTIMQRSARQLHRLINQLLNLAKLDSGKMKLQCSEYDLVSLIRNYIQSFESLAKQKNITLSFTSVQESLSCWVDKEKIEQVMNNLLSNAIKYTQKGGRVTVDVFSQNSANINQMTNNPLAEKAIISVSDTGPGISPGVLPYIFDRFYQGKERNNDGIEGTGIGLALTKELVELHHGEVKAESDPDKGTTFLIFLPLGREHLSEEETATNPERSEWYNAARESSVISRDEDFTPWLKPTEERRIIEAGDNQNKAILLIVEDNVDMRYYIRSYFEKDHNVLEAENGKEGILLARKYLPDIIISDVMMPGIDGIEFCRKIKSNDLTSHIPVILLTAKASRESRLEGLETGADDFITKPFDGEELFIRVSNLIKQRNHLKEQFRKEFEKSSKASSITKLSMHEQFLNKAFDIIEKHLSDDTFSVQKFAELMSLSRVQLHRKLTSIVNHNATDFIRVYRLNKAAEMIKLKTGRISEIAYDVGFSSPSYFTECFKKQYGVSPSDYHKNA